MTRLRFRHFAASTALALSLVVAVPPASAQWIVFDPNNFSQNVLTAARELQQITNQITSLQNEAQMLINQARNLASLPYSSLQQLQSSIQRTQQLLSQAQNIAYNVQQIDSAFQTTYGSANASQSNQALIANAQARWQNSVGALQDAMRVLASSAISTPTARRCRRSCRPANRPPARSRQPRPAIRSLRFRPSSLPISPPPSPPKDGRRVFRPPSKPPPRIRGRSSFGGS